MRTEWGFSFREDPDLDRVITATDRMGLTGDDLFLTALSLYLGFNAIVEEVFIIAGLVKVKQIGPSF